MCYRHILRVTSAASQYMSYHISMSIMVNIIVRYVEPITHFLFYSLSIQDLVRQHVPVMFKRGSRFVEVRLRLLFLSYLSTFKPSAHLIGSYTCSAFANSQNYFFLYI